MFHLALTTDSPHRPRAEALQRAGRARLHLLDRHTRLPEVPPTARVLVGSRLPPFFVHDAVLRAVGGRAADVRLLVDGPVPDAARLGFRLRPWLRGIHLPPSAPAPDPPPAPVIRETDLEAILDGWGPPPVRWSGQPSPFPPLLQIQTTTACEAHCPYCPYDDLAPAPARMPDDRFRRIVAQCGEHGAEALELYLHAEPLTDPDLERRATEAKAACPGALVSIVTHERSIDPGRAASLATSGLDVVFVSVNVLGRPSEQALARRLDRVAGCARAFAPGGRLVVSTLVDFLQPGVRGAFRRLCRERDLPVESFHATTRAGDATVAPWTRDDAPPDRGRCERPFVKAYVRVDGALVLCCEDWRYERVLGRVDEAPIARLWRSRAYEHTRERLLGGPLQDPCARCDYRGVSSSP